MKNRMCELIRAGNDRGTAANLISEEFGVRVTGTQFKRLTNKSSVTYDPDFADQYIQAMADRDQADYDGRIRQAAGAPRQTTDAGHTRAHFITDDDLDSFLERVEEGIPRDMAAREIGTSLLQIQRRAGHDPDFAARFKQALDAGYPAYQDWLRAQAVEFIKSGNYNALRDQVLIHLPEADKLRTSKHEIGGLDGGNLKVFIDRVFHNLPKELQDQIIKAVEAGETPPELKALPGGA